MTAIDHAILHTILYADIFDFPLTSAEIHHFLIHDEPASLEQIETALKTSAYLRQYTRYDRGYYCRAVRKGLVENRQAREQASAHLWPLAVRYGVWLARIPFVRMVAVTGALAVHNAASEKDDLDYMLVTSPNRVWLARAFSIVLVRLAKLRGVILCPNYVLSENALAQQKRDLFIAHEICQMRPLYGHELYWRFRAINQWSCEHLPNAEALLDPTPEYALSPLWKLVKNGLETLLGGRLGDRLERWEYRRKLRRFAGEMKHPHSAAQIDEQHVKGHFNDYGHPVLRKYHQRLHEYGFIKAQASVSGD